MRGADRDWSGLPQTAVYLILKGLRPGLADVFSLGKVCSKWRSVFKDSKREILSDLPPLLVDRGSSPGAFAGFYNVFDRRFYRRRQPIAWPWTCPSKHLCFSETYVVGASHGHWIVVSASFWGDRGAAFLLNPLSPKARIHLPPAPHPIREAFMTAPPTSPDCVIVASTEFAALSLYCRVGDTEWARIDFTAGGYAPDIGWGLFRVCYRVDQVAALGRKFYALATGGELLIVELLFPQASVTVMEVQGLPQKHSGAWLVESNGEILYVADRGGARAMHERTSLGTVGSPSGQEQGFVVLRLDLPARKWEALDTLGDRALFLNPRAMSVACVAGRLGSGGGDRIYSYCPSTATVVVFNMKDGTFERHKLTKGGACYDWLIPPQDSCSLWSKI